MSILRFLTYVAGLAAALLMLTGLADFDSTTGLLDLKPFNVYNLAGSIAAALSSSVAAVAWIAGWKGRK